MLEKFRALESTTVSANTFRSAAIPAWDTNARRKQASSALGNRFIRAGYWVSKYYLSGTAQTQVRPERWGRRAEEFAHRIVPSLAELLEHHGAGSPAETRM